LSDVLLAFLNFLAASPLLTTTSAGRLLPADAMDEESSPLADYLAKRLIKSMFARCA
jgi:hypothetical protein